MTSTEFTVGLDGSRVSSKVLKPPGGGSSDIFGFGGSQHSAANGTPAEKSKPATNTQSRLFGCSNDVPPSSIKTNRMQSNVFGNESPAAVKSKKKYVHRNPITGEEIEIDLEKYEKTETSIMEENGDKEDSEEKSEEEQPTKPVQTSIRVKNPPGGKSSGIFY